MANTAHHITDAWQLRRIVLGCDCHQGENQSGETTARLCRQVWEQYGFRDGGNIVAVVSDTAANMNAFGTLLDCPHNYCVAHVLELTTALAFDDEYLVGGGQVMREARRLVASFKHSPRATEKLLEAQRRLFPDATAVRVVEDVSTRWWSTLQMVERLLN
jgi:hypothetical protein